MAFIYETYGPFPIDRDGNKFRKAALDKLWEEVKPHHPGLQGAVGVYIVSVRASSRSRLKPWYVGKTDTQGFQRRFIQQLSHFSDILDYAKRGAPHVFLLARLKSHRGGFRKPTSKPSGATDKLETMMIASCLKRNKRLVNVNKVRHEKQIVVPGYMNNKRGKLTGSAAELNQMLKAKHK